MNPQTSQLLAVVGALVAVGLLVRALVIAIGVELALQRTVDPLAPRVLPGPRAIVARFFQRILGSSWLSPQEVAHMAECDPAFIGLAMKKLRPAAVARLAALEQEELTAKRPPPSVAVLDYVKAQTDYVTALLQLPLTTAHRPEDVRVLRASARQQYLALSISDTQDALAILGWTARYAAWIADAEECWLEDASLRTTVPVPPSEDIGPAPPEDGPLHPRYEDAALSTRALVGDDPC